MLTTILVTAASALATLAIVLLVLLVRATRARAPAPQPPPPPPRQARAHDLDALARDLHEVVARYRKSPQTEPRAAAGPSRAEPAAGSLDGPAGSPELEDLLAHALETARAIPGADGALVAVTPAREPIIGTLGLARHEADRLASTLPIAGSRTRSIAIAYEYEADARLDVPAGRIERGVAVPVPGVPVPALIAILTRAPAADLGEPQVALLEEVARHLSPALSAVLNAQATSTPVSISVHELDRRREPPPDERGTWSTEREEGHEGSQVDRLRRR
jgi:hypothetical protein